MSEFDDRASSPADLSYADVAGERSGAAAERLGFGEPEDSSDVDAESIGESGARDSAVRDSNGAESGGGSDDRDFGVGDSSSRNYGVSPSGGSAGEASEGETLFGESEFLAGGSESPTDASTVDSLSDESSFRQGDPADPATVDSPVNVDSEIAFDDAESDDPVGEAESDDFDVAVGEQFEAFGENDQAGPDDDEFTTIGARAADDGEPDEHVELSDSAGDEPHVTGEPAGQLGFGGEPMAEELAVGTGAVDESQDVSAGDAVNVEAAEVGEMADAEGVDAYNGDGFGGLAEAEGAALARVEADSAAGEFGDLDDAPADPTAGGLQDAQADAVAGGVGETDEVAVAGDAENEAEFDRSVGLAAVAGAAGEADTGAVARAADEAAEFDGDVESAGLGSAGVGGESGGFASADGDVGASGFAGVDGDVESDGFAIDGLDADAGSVGADDDEALAEGTGAEAGAAADGVSGGEAADTEVGETAAAANDIPDDIDPVAAQVLALRGRLAELDDLPLEQHPTYYDDLHSELTNALAQIDRAQNS